MIAGMFWDGDSDPHRTTELVLTRREREILKLIADGLSNRAIACQLWLSARTVESHTRAIFQKLSIGAGDDVNQRVCAARAHWEHSSFVAASGARG
jgi:ATP/maltotriose-dependent transcriptional regulator MalT